MKGKSMSIYFEIAGKVYISVTPQDEKGRVVEITKDHLEKLVDYIAVLMGVEPTEIKEVSEEYYLQITGKEEETYDA